jgi:hypothetical protein
VLYRGFVIRKNIFKARDVVVHPGNKTPGIEVRRIQEEGTVRSKKEKCIALHRMMLPIPPNAHPNPES